MVCVLGNSLEGRLAEPVVVYAQSCRLAALANAPEVSLFEHDDLVVCALSARAHVIRKPINERVSLWVGTPIGSRESETTYRSP